MDAMAFQPRRGHHLSALQVGLFSFLVFGLVATAFVYSMSLNSKLQDCSHEVAELHRVHEERIEKMTKELTMKMKQLEDRARASEKDRQTRELQLQKDLGEALHAVQEEKSRAQRLHRDNVELHKQLDLKRREVKVLEEHAHAFEKEMHTLTTTIKSMEGGSDDVPPASDDYEVIYKRQAASQAKLAGQESRDVAASATMNLGSGSAQGSLQAT